MFGDIVGNQYIGKSKLDICMGNGLIRVYPTQLINNLCKKMPDSIRVAYKYAPDYYLPCNVIDMCTISIPADPVTDRFKYILMITGIPKKVPLSNFKFIEVTWQSYYEDSYRGYLFQLMRVDIFMKYFDKERFGSLYRELLIY